MSTTHLLHLDIDLWGFANFSLTCEDPTHATCRPDTGEDYCNIVEWAAAEGVLEYVDGSTIPPDPSFPVPVTFSFPFDDCSPIIKYDPPTTSNSVYVVTYYGGIPVAYTDEAVAKEEAERAGTKVWQIHTAP